MAILRHRPFWQWSAVAFLIRLSPFMIAYWMLIARNEQRAWLLASALRIPAQPVSFR